MTKQLISLPHFIVDAFTNKPFSGNQAAICLVSRTNVLGKDLKQNIAAEMNLSETAFITLKTDEDSFELSQSFKLEWFSPKEEIPLCGHATLASSLVIFNCIGNQNKSLEFQTLSGNLYVTKNQDGSLSMDFPNNCPEKITDIEIFQPLIKAVIGSLEYEEVQYSSSTTKLLIRLKDCYKRGELESLKPQEKEMIAAAPHSLSLMGVIVTLRGDETCGYDFMSRYFAPWIGILEDPVTGSAHTVLAPYWSTVLGKKSFFARQCSPRGGELSLRLKEPNRVLIDGHGVVVVKGTLAI